jgi:ribosomal protein S18 acetylase RimI-like enzyme
MRESFSKPLPSKFFEQTIDEGVREYLRNKLDMVGDETEIAIFGNEVADDPLTKNELEGDINGFIFDNYEHIVSLVTSNTKKDLRKFKILNSDLRNYGFYDTSFYVFDNNYNTQILDVDEGGYNTDDFISNANNYFGESKKNSKFSFKLLENKELNLDANYHYSGASDVNFAKESQVLTAAYLKNKVRVDTKLNIGAFDSEYVNRYYLRDLDRYLCINDFGMKPYNDKADVTNIWPFANAVERKIRRTLSNIQKLYRSIDNNDFSEYIENLEENQTFEIYQTIENEKKRIFIELVNSKIGKELVTDAIPFPKFKNEIGLKDSHKISEHINSDLGNETDLYKRLKYFESDKFQRCVSNLIFDELKTIPGLNKAIIGISSQNKEPVLMNEYDYRSVISKVQYVYIEQAKQRIIDATQNGEIRNLVENISSGRGELSPHYFDKFSFFEMIEKIGIEKFFEIYPSSKQKILEEGEKYIDVSINEFIEGVNGVYWIFGEKIRDFSSDKLKKEIWHHKTFSESLLFDYLAERGLRAEKPFTDHDYSNSRNLTGEALNEYRNTLNKYWATLTNHEKVKLFNEGKKIYWIGKQVQKKIFELEQNKSVQGRIVDSYESNDSVFRFYSFHDEVRWDQYDVQNIDIDKFLEHFNKHGNIICTMIGSKLDDGIGSHANLETMMGIINALEAGADMRGVALAFDKKRYLEGILSGQEQENDLEYALKDWPSSLRDMVSVEEFQVYFENAEQYLYQDPKGMVRYAELLQKEPQIREILGEKIEKKSDLDLRLCLSVQTSEVRGWYLEGAEYVGHPALQRYFVRFQATREQTGGYPNLHDALYWIPNIKRVEVGEARALLDDIDTMDESNELKNFLPRYDKEKDPLKADGAIKSLRELKKRVFALEANFDFSTLSPQMFDVISAPGFNLSELQRLQNEQRFVDLLEGRLNKDQPFMPHKRTFTARPLHEILKEGLGSFKEKIRGTAQDPKGMFDAVRKLMKDKEVNGRQMQIQDLLREVPLDMEEDILKLLQEQRVATGALLEATVHEKSDPEGWVCGNYTDCCMPFGDSKNTDYMFNKGTQYFTIKYNGRIIAQSVVVDSLDRRSNEDVIILDNIEVANNYKNQSALLSRVYKTFWAEYTSKKVKIGTGYSDLIPDGARLESNNFSPKHSLSYSDAKGSQIYDLPKIRGVESLDNILTFANLTERDVETIAEMEKESYPEGLIQGKGQALEVIRKQRELELPGAASSFILRQGNEPAGYLLVLPEESKMNSGENVAHIYDMVVLPKFQGGIVARKMMERMLDTAKAYDVPAIEFEARESTSYRLITNPRIAKWIENKGYKLTYNEPLPDYLGGENFYYVRLENINNS